MKNPNTFNSLPTYGQIESGIMKTAMPNNLREMNEDELAIFCTLELSKDVTELYDEIIKNGGWVLNVIRKRFSVYDIETDKKVLIMVLAMGDGAAGLCVKYVDDIANWSSENKCKKIDWSVFTKLVYPNGFPIF